MMTSAIELKPQHRYRPYPIKQSGIKPRRYVEYSAAIPHPAPNANLPVCAPYICPEGDNGTAGIGLRGAGVTLFSKSA